MALSLPPPVYEAFDDWSVSANRSLHWKRFRAHKDTHTTVRLGKIYRFELRNKNGVEFSNHGGNQGAHCIYCIGDTVLYALEKTACR